MILYELVGQTENHPAYAALAEENRGRHYDFLRSAVEAALAVDRSFLSQTVIKALNYHAIACLHGSAGIYRPWLVTVDDYIPPEHYRVPDLMDDFVNSVNRMWETEDPVRLSAYVLWRLNWIHPFINGNGRTARAASYFVICVKIGIWPNTATILPELLRRPENRDQYVSALRYADEISADGTPNLDPMVDLLTRLLREQLAT